MLMTSEGRRAGLGIGGLWRWWSAADECETKRGGAGPGRVQRCAHRRPPFCSRLGPQCEDVGAARRLDRRGAPSLCAATSRRHGRVNAVVNR